jgi:anti-sigma B factor antagonist
MIMSLNFDIQEQVPVHVLSLKGKIMSDDDVKDLKNAVERLPSNLVIDISELTHTNSSGINFFIKTLTRCRVNGGELVLNGLNGSVKKLFELAKINGLFVAYDSLEDSLKHFK